MNENMNPVEQMNRAITALYLELPESVANDVRNKWNNAVQYLSITPTPRTFSEQDLLDVWDACRTYMKQWEQFKHYDDAPSMTAPEKQQFFKTRFNITLK